MDFFTLNSEFEDLKSVLEMKKLYEESSKTVLTISKSSKLKGESILNDKIVYDRIIFGCKAGAEKPTQSHGHRKSSTYKKNCPAKVS